MSLACLGKQANMKPHELQSKLLKAGFIGNYMGDYYRLLRGIPGVLDFSSNVQDSLQV